MFITNNYEREPFTTETIAFYISLKKSSVCLSEGTPASLNGALCGDWRLQGKKFVAGNCERSIVFTKNFLFFCLQKLGQLYDGE